MDFLAVSAVLMGIHWFHTLATRFDNSGKAQGRQDPTIEAHASTRYLARIGVSFFVSSTRERVGGRGLEDYISPVRFAFADSFERRYIHQNPVFPFFFCRPLFIVL